MHQKQVIIGLSNPKSASNVGATLRAAGCYGVDKVIYTGTRYDRAVKLNTDTKKMKSQIALLGVSHLLENKEAQTKVICVDLIEGAIPLPNFEHPDNALYLFGPEDGTLSQSLIDSADAVVYIPTQGCMNLAATVNVVLYDRLAKSAQHQTNNQLIRDSRDNNNRVKIKKQKRVNRARSSPIKWKILFSKQLMRNNKN